ncbi:MAG: patatin-like phospholipase family protein, partial [Bradymonadia bacterium]
MSLIAKDAALVLAGGGARGAYEVGVIMGVTQVLAPFSGGVAPFKIFTGTSVGAINASFFAAHADQADLGASALRDIWSSLDWSNQLGFSWSRALRLFRGGGGVETTSLADATALQEMIGESIPWPRLRQMTRSGHLDALVVAALQIYSGQTTLFAQLSDDVEFSPSRDPRRRLVETEIRAEHVLASSAIPFLFQPQRIDGRWYCDGSIRFNTPISPAIRCGADRLMVVGVRQSALAKVTDGVEPPPGLGTMLGKLL